MEIKRRKSFRYVTNSRLKGVNDKKMYPGNLKAIAANNFTAIA
jgi:hypothetical protein